MMNWSDCKRTMSQQKKFQIKQFKRQLKTKLGLDIASRALTIYQLAFIHGSSNIQDSKGHPLNFERLEFLGDAIINLMIIEEIYRRFPSAS